MNSPTEPRIIDTPDVSILHYLHRVRAVDDGHISAAMTYLDWQCAFKAIGGYRGMAFGRSDTMRADGNSADTKADCWMRLILQEPASGQKDFRLARKHQEAVEAAVAIRPIPKEAHKVIYDGRADFIDALNRLGHLISEINEFFLE